MLASQFLEAANGAPNSRALDTLSRQLWTCHGEGHLTDPEASAVATAVAARRRAFAAGQGFPAPCRPNGRQRAP